MKNRKYMPVVYICSPYAGDIERNTNLARKYSRFAVDEGYIPIAMHLLCPQYMDDGNPKERSLAMHMNYVILGKCEEIWVFGDRVSDGMERELNTAKKRKMKTRYFNTDLTEAR